MTRGEYEHHLYLIDRQSEEPDTAHFHLLAEERRETDEGACELLIQTAGRDRSGIVPHQVWQAAKQDFDLAWLSSNQRTDVTPFAGTRMAAVMDERRRQRLRTTPQPPPQE